MDRATILAENYPLQDILEQNDIENIVVVEFLLEEGLINLNDYFYEEDLIDD